MHAAEPPPQDMASWFRVRALPHGQYSDGNADEKWLYNARSVLYHANYRVGKTKKREKLRELGLWFVGSDWNSGWGERLPEGRRRDVKCLHPLASQVAASQGRHPPPCPSPERTR